jgi:MarR family transcriptional regulator, organic hydroperoxide resistance regulator
MLHFAALTIMVFAGVRCSMKLGYPDEFSASTRSGRARNIGVKELADYLHVSGSFITQLISKFVKNGLVAKQPDPDDKRRVRLNVTQKGHDLLATLAPVQRQVNDVQFGPLSCADFQFLLRVLRQLIESSDKAVALQKYLEPPLR